MSLTLHHADDLEPLLDRLGDVLATPLADPFTADVVVVPTAGVRDAVTAHLGARLGASARGGDGITANIDLLYIGRFVNRAFGLETHGDDLEPDPWHISRLTWTVLDALVEGGVEVPVENVTWSFARRVADLFDRYATQRPQLIQAWALGNHVDGVFAADGTAAQVPADHMWQYRLWNDVRRRIGRPSLPERLPGLLDAIRTGALEPDLPPRVALVGFGSLAPAQWSVLQALAQSREVHVMLRTPSREAWQAGKVALGGALVSLRDVPDLDDPHRHPLVVSWGRRAIEARAFIAGTSGVQTVDANAPITEPDSFLRALQSDIRLDRAPTPLRTVDAADRSLQVHACHGDVRQIEVLRDALGHLFVDHPDLRPRDVVVLCPRLERFASLVEAVFSRGSMRIPVRVGDRSLTDVDPTADAFQAVLSLVVGRVSLTDVLGLLRFAPVRRRFGWSASDTESITSWALDMGVRWGLDADHRTEWELPAEVGVGTWRSAVQQLLAGVAQSAPTARIGLGGIPPFRGIDSQSAALVGALAEFVDRLQHLRDSVAGDRPIAEWVPILRHALEAFCATDPDEPWAFADVRSAIEDLLEAATPAEGSASLRPSPVPLTIADVRVMLGEAIRERAGRLALRTGSVTVTSLRPLHGVPARVVCVLGLDDASLPAGSFDGDDILGVNPCVGERNPRHDGRQMLLDSFLAARDAVIITCDGSDIVTNVERPFTVSLSELLDVAATTAGTTSEVLPLVVRHPRHGFDDKVFQTTPAATLVPGLPRPFTFDPAMLDAARARREARAVLDPLARAARWRLDAVCDEHLSTDDIVSVCGDPARQLLQRRLRVSSVPEAHMFDDDLPLEVDGLKRYELGDRLIDLAASRHVVGAADLVAGWDSTVEEWRRILSFDGSVPALGLGDAERRRVSSIAESIVATAHERAIPLRGPGTVDVALDLLVPNMAGTPSAVSVTGSIAGIHRRPGGDDEGVVVRVTFGKHKHSHKLKAAVSLALCHLADPSTSWSAELISRHSDDDKAALRVIRLAGDPAESAATLVELAVQLTWWARCDAVPLFDSASFTAGGASRTQDKGAPSNLGDDLGQGLGEVLWRGWDARSLFAVPLLVGDPVWLEPWEHYTRLGAVAQWVWSTYRRCIIDKTPSASLEITRTVTSPVGGAS